MELEYTGTEFKISVSDNSVWKMYTSSPITFRQATYINYQVIPDDEPIPASPTNFLYIPFQQALNLQPPLNPPKGPAIGFEYQYQLPFSSSAFNALVSTVPWQGTIRIIKFPSSQQNNATLESLFDQYASSIPISGSASYFHTTVSSQSPSLLSKPLSTISGSDRPEASGQNKVVGFTFKYQCVDMNFSPTNSPPLMTLTPLLLSQLDPMSSGSPPFSVQGPAMISSRGQMQYVTGSQFWFSLPHTVPPVYLDNNVKILSGRGGITANDTSVLLKQLQWDARFTNVTTFTDSYTGGKQLQALAEVLLMLTKQMSDLNYTSSSIGETVGPNLYRLKEYTYKWYNNSFFYDESWGGIVDVSGLIRCTNDYSNLLYQDHQFHYGYFVNTASMIAYLDNIIPLNYSTAPAVASLLGQKDPVLGLGISPHTRKQLISALQSSDFYKLGAAQPNPTRWVDLRLRNSTILEAVNSMVRDVYNPSTKDAYFPVLRVVDWEEGHSRAQGIFPSGSGGNEESTAEDINFYFGMMMWGSATNNDQMVTIGQIMVGRIGMSAAAYWQVGSSTTIYEGSQQTLPVEPSSGVNEFPAVGIIWDDKADPNTWFYGTDYCAVGIQTIARLPGLLFQLVDPVWMTRIINYFVNPSVPSNQWHIWSIPESQANWYSILLPAISLQYPSASRIVWNDPRFDIDDGNTRGSILFCSLYWQSAGAQISGPYPLLTPANSTWPPPNGFPIDAQQKYQGLITGPIPSYQSNLNALPSIQSMEAAIEANAEILGLNYLNYPTPQAWQQQANVYAQQYQQFNNAYNAQVNATIGMAGSALLQSWQAFAQQWGLPVQNSVQAIQEECTDQLQFLNNANNLCQQNVASMNNIVESQALTSCLNLLDDLSTELLLLSKQTNPPSTLLQLQYFAVTVVNGPSFLSNFPYIDSDCAGESCIQTFCDYCQVPMPDKYILDQC